MIWVRRFFAVVLAILFIVLYIPVLAVFRVNDTIGNPRFYVDQLRQADIYNFVYDEALPAALEEFKPGGDTSETPLDISKFKPEITSMVKQALPPEWLQAQVEQVITRVLPYVLGDVNAFNMAIPLKDRVEAATEATKETLHKGDTFSSIYDQAIVWVLDMVTKSDDQIPLNLSRAELESAIRTVLPPDWLISQIDNAIDQMVPYLTKESESFLVRLDISQRMDALETVVADTLKRPPSYEAVLKIIVDSVAGEGLRLDMLPAGVTVTSEEVLQAVKGALPPEWYQPLVSDIVRQVFSYLKGTRETLEVVLPLADRKSAIATSLTELAGRRLEAYISSLSTCTPAQLEQMLFSTGTDDLPTCRPPGFSYTRQGSNREIFLIRIDLSQETETLAAVLANVIEKPENYERFLNSMSAAVTSQGVAQLPIGLTLSSDEVTQALRNAFPMTWYQSLANNIAGQVTPYLTGSRETLEVTVPVADRKPALTASLAELADQKLEAYVNSLPLCTPEQLAEMLANPPRGHLPTCRPEGYSYSQVKSLLGIDLAAEVASLLTTTIPDQWSFTQADMTQMFGGQDLLAQAREQVRNGITFTIDLSTYIAPALATSIPDRWVLTESDVRQMFGGEEGTDPLVRAREWVRDGITFSEENLRSLVGTESQAIDKVRQQIADGLSFTHEDPRNWLKKADGIGGEQTLRNIDQFRSYLSMARRWKMIAWVIPALLLVCIGLLGGRRWSSKLLWAAAVLLVTAVITYVAFGPVFSSLAQPKIDDALAQMAAQGQGIQAVMTDKGLDMATGAIDAFVGGLQRHALILTGTSVLLIALGVFWRLRGTNQGHHKR
ncbi:MAG: hypothetical protein AB1603_04365 [Chloroflexota bacterium]